MCPLLGVSAQGGFTVLGRFCTEFDRESTGSSRKQESQIVQICEMCRCDPEENFRLGDIVTELKFPT